jgi:hypothetical protein
MPTNPIFVDDRNKREIDEIYINRWYARLVKSNVDNKAELPDCGTIISKMATRDFINFLIDSNENELMPRNCRFSKTQFDGSKTFVIEEMPMVRSVKIGLELDSEIAYLTNLGLLSEYGYDNFLKDNPFPPYRMQLSFPYIIYIVTLSKDNMFKKLQIFYRLHPLTSLDDYLLKTNLLNVSPDMGDVCLGLNRDDYNSEANTAVERVDNIIRQFWANDFNKDITSSYLLYKDNPYISTILAWKYFSQVDPMFLFDVEWIKHAENLEEYVYPYKCGEDDFMYQLTSLISKNQEVHDNNGDYKGVISRVYTSNSICLSRGGESGVFLEIGDEIEIDECKYYIYEIKAGRGDSEIIVEDEDGNRKNILLTDKLIEILKNNIKNKKVVDEVEINGEIIRPGTILQSTDPYSNGRIKVVDNIRKTRDKRFEIKCKNKYYFLTNGDCIKNIKVFDTSNVIFNGEKLSVNKNYMIRKYWQAHRAAMEISFGKFKKLTVDDKSTDLSYYFEIVYTDNVTDVEKYTSDDPMQITQIHKKIDDIEEQLCPPIFRYGSTLLTNLADEYKFYMFKDVGVGVALPHRDASKRYIDYNYVFPDELPMAKRKEIESYILKDNELRIPAHDIDISFDIGDKVVIADYSQTAKFITTVRTITGFRFDEHDVLFVDTVDDDNNIVSVPYIIPSNSNGNREIYHRLTKIRAGIIRKIHKTEDLKGIKVRSKMAGIPMFKKKDVYETIGVIADTGTESIILCSNGHTIWNVNKVLENYEFVNKKSKLYDKWQIADNNKRPDMKVQQGDLLDGYAPDVTTEEIGNYRDELRFFTCLRGLPMRSKCVSYTSSLFYNSGYKVDLKYHKHARYQTIPMPRVTPKSVFAPAPILAVPNFHGWFTKSPKEGNQYSVIPEVIE